MDVRLITKSGVEERGVEELPLLLQGEDNLVWVDIPAWDDEAVRVLSEVFRFHPLAVNDAMERNRVPKMHAYHDHVFVILHAPERGKHGHVHYIELDQFVGLRYLVTVHGPINPAVHPDVALRETGAVLQRIQAGRLRPATAAQLSHAIVTVLTREQEDFIETLTKDVWQLEQRLTGGEVGDPEKYLNELFRARHGLLAVRTMGAQSGAIYHSMTTLTGISADGRQLVADTAQQFDRVRSLADGETEYLHGVIEFYQTVLSDTSRPGAERKGATADRGQLRPERRNQKDLRLGGDLLRPHPDRHGLRHELRPHARAALGDRIPFRAARNGAVVGRPLLVVQTAQVAVKMLKSVPKQRRPDHLKVLTRRRLSDHLVSHHPKVGGSPPALFASPTGSEMASMINNKMISGTHFVESLTITFMPGRTRGR
jgi:Mg2+ and Co2+ transporter CorA